MRIIATGWKNKKGTSNRSCKCDSWKQHWINNLGKDWSDKCSILGCNNKAILGAHIFNTASDVTGEYIVPACDSCNKLDREFDLKGGITLILANKQKICEQ